MSTRQFAVQKISHMIFHSNFLFHFTVKDVYKDEKKYYEDLLAHSRSNLMLFPYHLADVIVKGLRITPFQYYISIIESMMDNDKSYDSIPNFTAIDCMSDNFYTFLLFIE